MVRQALIPPAKQANRKSTAACGFTLIEMLVVLSIIALLLSIAVPRYFGAIEHSRELVLKDTLGILRSSIDAFHSDRGRYPTDLNELVDQHYLRSVPVDPITESDKSWNVTTSSDIGGTGVSDVHSGAPGKTRNGQAYAEF